MAERLADVLTSLGYRHEAGTPHVPPSKSLNMKATSAVDTPSSLVDLLQSVLSIQQSRPLLEWMTEAFDEPLHRSLKLSKVEGLSGGGGDGDGEVRRAERVLGFDILTEDEGVIYDELAQRELLEELNDRTAFLSADADISSFISQEEDFRNDINSFKSRIKPLDKHIQTLHAQIKNMRLLKEENDQRLRRLMDHEEDLDRRIAKQCSENAHASGQVDSALHGSAQSIDGFLEALDRQDGGFLFQAKSSVREFIESEDEEVKRLTTALHDEFGEINMDKAVKAYQTADLNAPMNEILEEEIDRLVSVFAMTEKQHFEELLGHSFTTAKLHHIRGLQDNSELESHASLSRVKLAQNESKIKEMMSSVDRIRKSELGPLWTEAAEAEVRAPVMAKIYEAKRRKLELMLERIAEFKKALEEIFERKSTLNGSLHKDFELLRHQSHVIESLNHELAMRRKTFEDTMEYLSLPELEPNRPSPRFMDTADRILISMKEALEGGTENVEEVIKQLSQIEDGGGPERSNPTIVCSLETLYNSANSVLHHVEEVQRSFETMKHARLERVGDIGPGDGG
ncbi:hypothetical protein HDU67_009030 [Dinochytrium kinnereticum]|nr:hypothetical protein HDU67_009030 [Dinochytrium kinnereticum]